MAAVAQTPTDLKRLAFVESAAANSFAYVTGTTAFAKACGYYTSAKETNALKVRGTATTSRRRPSATRSWISAMTAETHEPDRSTPTRVPEVTCASTNAAATASAAAESVEGPSGASAPFGTTAVRAGAGPAPGRSRAKAKAVPNRFGPASARPPSSGATSTGR